MLNFLFPKTKVQMWNIVELPLEAFEMYGVAQINPYCQARYENNIYITMVDFMNESREYDERETLVLSKIFTLRKCPKCKRIELFPTKLKVNFDPKYLRYEEEVACDAYSELPSKTNTPSLAYAFCSACNSAFEIRIKAKDLWVKQAKKLKDKDLIVPWEEYQIENY